MARVRKLPTSTHTNRNGSGELDGAENAASQGAECDGGSTSADDSTHAERVARAKEAWAIAAASGASNAAKFRDAYARLAGLIK